jgi:hypothetical protein
MLSLGPGDYAGVFMVCRHVWILKQEELQRDKTLTILIGIAKTCEENDVESIRNSILKKLNNDRLSEFTQIRKVCKPAR